MTETKEILKVAKKVFPYSSMNKGFQGAHHFIVDRKTGNLVLCVWFKNHLFSLKFTDAELKQYDTACKLQVLMVATKEDIKKRFSKK